MTETVGQSPASTSVVAIAATANGVDRFLKAVTQRLSLVLTSTKMLTKRHRMATFKRTISMWPPHEWGKPHGFATMRASNSNGISHGRRRIASSRRGFAQADF